MTTYPPEHASETPIARAGQVPSQAAPAAADLAFGLIDVLSGAGFAFMSFLAPIPGLLPAVILAVLLIAPLFIPLLVVGAAAGLLFGILRVAARALGLGASLVVRLAPTGRTVLRPPKDTRASVSPVIHTGS